MGGPVTVNVIAPDPVLESGTIAALSGSPDVAVVTRDEPASVTVVIGDDVDDVILDIVRTTRASNHRPAIVVLATNMAPAQALQTIASGARGLLWRREANGDRLTRAVLAAATGDCTVSPEMLDRLLDVDGPGRSDPPEGGLSERERAVLAMVAEGRETDEIARALCYSTRTVTSVVHDITHRFRLRNRAHAVAYALRAGLL
ncbi:response regulator transcription factor [Phytohabitans rumicis]|uniref:Helix-turn-helix transcriptional regulator n=1 Tax=Phytohabitans rumicis TaxID=1076125 RepID=A0A6V8LI30_9ACTN|nr:response regulator transcription factor [Phytohabitans rumicis]GFJ93757.1 helix-turn-helix transcriptional regulator [Phytohabitans rumicis]